MTTLEQKLQEECNSQMYYLTPKQVIKIVEEWLPPNVKKTFYKNLMPDFSGKIQKAIEKSIKELLEELK